MKLMIRAAMDLLDVVKISNVYHLSGKQAQFSEHYLKIRSQENRLYQDDLVKRLPHLPNHHPHYDEWRLRISSMERVLRFIKEKRCGTILDLGCGNGWLSGNIAKATDSCVFGVDVNQTELEQAARLFTAENCGFIYWNIFQEDWPGPSIDLIILDSTIQYFPSLPSLLDRVMNLLSDRGEIFILDSPIYNSKELSNAQDRSREYFIKKGVPEMINRYHHHSWDELGKFNYRLLYDPKIFMSRLKRKIFKNESPFPFIGIRR